MGRFDNKVTLITGSSNGIGKATAILFAKEGSKVTITGRDTKALQATKEECIKAGAKESDILDLIGDITLESVQDGLIQKTIDKFGKLDILVSNHGGIRAEVDQKGNFLLEAFDPAIEQNCKSTLAMCMKALPHLVNTKGNIVIVSSNVSQIAAEKIPFYAMSKAALDQLTKTLAYKYADAGIRVNAVNPGPIETTIAAKSGIPKEFTDMFKGRAKEYVPMGRIGEPIEIAHPIAFLADDVTSSYMTGQTMIIDGGLTLDLAAMRIFKEKS